MSNDNRDKIYSIKLIMNLTRYIYLTLLVSFTAIISFTNNALGWDLTDLIFNEKITKEIIYNNKTNNLKPDFYFLSPADNKDFFESINDLSICRNKNVRKFINLYLTDGREYLTTAIIRSNRHLKTVEDICKENNDIPKDISLLPLLESAYNPYAVSRSKAVGLWQFLKGTSKSLNLKVNNWVDERRDVEKSTIAAIRHLRNLYATFGSWEPALAAYNGGAGYIKRTMRKKKTNSFSQLVEKGALIRETNEYIYRFAALLVIYKNQKLFDIEERNTVPPLPESENIVFEYPVKIQQAALLCGVHAETLRLLNPELKQNITPPYENKYTFRVPKGCKEKLENNITSLYDIKYNKLKKHVVKRGENLSRIAAVYKTEVKKIVLLNDLKDPRSIKPGLELYIPI
jgi:membrane-bound lytic murein transglycosylase D